MAPGVLIRLLNVIILSAIYSCTVLLCVPSTESVGEFCSEVMVMIICQKHSYYNIIMVEGTNSALQYLYCSWINGEYLRVGGASYLYPTV